MSDEPEGRHLDTGQTVLRNVLRALESDQEIGIADVIVASGNDRADRPDI